MERRKLRVQQAAHPARIPQGSLLGPVLVNICMNDMPSMRNDKKVVISRCADGTNVTTL